MKEILKEKVPFTQITNEVANSGMSLKALGLYLYMYSKPNGWNFTIRSMASQMKDGNASIRTAMNELKSNGWVDYKKKNDGSGVYNLLVKAKVRKSHNAVSQTSKITQCKKPNEENPNFENRNVRKSQRISNTNLNSNKDSSNTNYNNIDLNNNKELIDSKKESIVEVKKSKRKPKEKTAEEIKKSEDRKEFIQMHSDWHLEQLGVPYKFSGAKDGTAVKQMITYLEKVSHGEILNSWSVILGNYTKWGKFEMQMTTLAQINSMFNNILTNIKNSKNGRKGNKENPNKGIDYELQERARKLFSNNKNG